MAVDESSDTDPHRTVYLHCRGGIGRTPTVAIALLMQRDLTLAEAHRMVLTARPETSPTPPQLDWLRDVEARRQRLHLAD